MKTTSLAAGFMETMRKIAAPANGGGARGQQMAPPTSPLQIENDALMEQIQNIQLKLQLRQMQQAQGAIAQSEQQAMLEEQQQQEQQQQMQFPPAPGRGMPQAGGAPIDPQSMVGGR